MQRHVPIRREISDCFIEFLPNSSAEGIVGKVDFLFFRSDDFAEHPGSVPFEVPAVFGGILSAEVTFQVVFIRCRALFQKAAAIAVFPVGAILGFEQIAHGIWVAELGFSVVFRSSEIAALIMHKGGLARHGVEDFTQTIINSPFAATLMLGRGTMSQALLHRTSQVITLPMIRNAAWQHPLDFETKGVLFQFGFPTGLGIPSRHGHDIALDVEGIADVGSEAAFQAGSTTDVVIFQGNGLTFAGFLNHLAVCVAFELDFRFGIDRGFLGGHLGSSCRFSSRPCRIRSRRRG